MSTKIEWADETWNPVTGCTPVSAGCQNCYAKRMATRLRGRHGYPEDEPFKVTLRPGRLEQPLGWKKPRRVFVCSMGDLFHPDVPFEFIFKVWAAMLSPICFKHTFLILTKRPERMLEFYRWCQERNKQGMVGLEFERPHIWLGVTAENQDAADQRIPILLQIPAAVRFVSAEPMLGPVDLNQLIVPGDNPMGYHVSALHEQHDDCLYDSPTQLDWVICGGESGPGARPMQPEWPRELRDQCQAAGVPFFFKQWGKWVSPSQMPGETYRGIEGFGDGIGITDNPRKVGKKRAGRLLDGREWNEYPGEEQSK